MLQVVLPFRAIRFFAGRSAFALRARSLIPALVCLLFAVPPLAQIQPPLAPEVGSPVDAQAALDQATSGLTFIENHGQWDAEVRYLARLGGLDAWVTDSGLVFDFYERTSVEADGTDARAAEPAADDDSRRGHVVRMRFEGAAAGEVAGTHRLEGYHNYFLGDDPSRWATNVPLYGEVMVSELYDGVGMRLYGDGGLLRYDLLTAPGADLSQVRLRLEGAGAVLVTPEGDLAMETSLGEVRQAGLLAYQEIQGRQVAVPAAFNVLGDSVVGFDVEPLDPSLPLVIDPLIYSTLLGGSQEDRARAIAVDASGNAFVAGRTQGVGFPTTAGAYRPSYPGGDWSAYVTKLNASGTDLVYSTYLGGADFDLARGIAVDDSGYAFVGGWTRSENFPTTAGAYQMSYPGGSASAFVAKLDASGADLQYSTYLGGADIHGWDYIYAIAVDADSNAFVAGRTSSDNFPTTEGAYQPTDPGGFHSAFVTRLDASGANLVYSTYLGSAERDIAFAIAVDASGSAHVTGETRSADFPTTKGAFQAAWPGDPRSGFVTKLDASGTSLVYSTFLGGEDQDRPYGIAVDASGHAFVAGWTRSSDFPTTEGAYQTTYPGGDRSVFVTKLDASGTSLVYSTFLGGEDREHANALTVDSSDNAFVAGHTRSSLFPTTEDAHQTTRPGDRSAFVSKLDASGADLIYSTYLGGEDREHALAIAVDGSANAFVAGHTQSTDFPTTDGAYQTTYPGGFRSAFVTKLDPSGAVSIDPGGSLPRDFALHSAYPNPLTIQTTLVFEVSRSAHVRIEAFDLLGRRMATIVDEQLESGQHERVFDASALSSGVYVVRMTSEGFSQSRRVVVVR